MAKRANVTRRSLKQSVESFYREKSLLFILEWHPSEEIGGELVAAYFSYEIVKNDFKNVVLEPDGTDPVFIVSSASGEFENCVLVPVEDLVDVTYDLVSESYISAFTYKSEGQTFVRFKASVDPTLNRDSDLANPDMDVERKKLLQIVAIPIAG